MGEEDSFFGYKEKHNAKKPKIGTLGLNEKGKLYYLFDYGDDWWHEVTLLKIYDTKDSKGYPRIVKKAGESPPQYRDYEEYEE